MLYLSFMSPFPILFAYQVFNVWGAFDTYSTTQSRLDTYELVSTGPGATAGDGIAPGLLVSSKADVSSQHHPIGRVRKPRHREANATWSGSPARGEV